ncbi:hypothetical protein PUNSTDRAFT_108838 [Punctularia strigosozonata HHB-11173 SS5]|uniref:Cytochrome c oxidase, subunit VIb n=1 Tax=Punctularia strigosozonata (strain HHB-11173) TaxID=741275 RepID=R7S197_PUNST|nr:uncharacterized protein PUNSTDRAFT_108838 [Punctularia strigosozonata HHB-11173 SS5]EIN03998.1 hypothetical protein PUNSTDRAFT_108838 [Punctularia strigosozonata HHB-11173 SS5]
MGWFSSSKPQQPDAASRSDRQKCWDSRDAYFKCLDAAGILTPGEETGARCKAENEVYEQNCAKSWIDYFNKRRVLAEQQKSVLIQADNQRHSARK